MKTLSTTITTTTTTTITITIKTRESKIFLVVREACRTVIVVVIVIGDGMGFGHEKLDVYKVALKYVAWVYNLCKRLKGMDRHARDQILRASQSIALNIAEG